MYRKIIKAQGKDVNELEISLSYSLGGMNYFTGRPEGRGYYLHVVPQERCSLESGFTSISTTCFAGVKVLLKEVKRQSKKAELEAQALIPEWEDRLIEDVCKRNDIVLI